jgi:flagellar biosynthesis protein FlhA
MTPVLLVPAILRITLSKFLRRAVPHLRVLSHDELPDSKTIRVTSFIGG